MSEEQTFEQMLEETFKQIHNGEVLDGEVIEVRPDEAILNIGYKYDGVLTRREYSNEVAINYVISQTPAADESFPRADGAVIVISKGKENEIHTSPTNPKTTKPKEEASTGATKPAQSGDYLLPGSDSTYLSESDLTHLDREKLNLALNEIFARHGRRFSDASIRAYFESKSWYNGTVSPSDFDMSVLNQYELYNLNLISAYQEDLGYR